MFIDFLGGRGMLLRQPRWTWRWWRMGWTDVLLTKWDTLDVIWIWKEKKKRKKKKKENGLYRRQNMRFISSVKRWKTRSKRCWTTRLTTTLFGRKREQQTSSSKLRRRKREEEEEEGSVQFMPTAWNILKRTISWKHFSYGQRGKAKQNRDKSSGRLLDSSFTSIYTNLCSH